MGETKTPAAEEETAAGSETSPRYETVQILTQRKNGVPRYILT